jgi:5'-nucleotidase
MRVLCTNDDGISSPGLHALAQHLHRAGHDVIVAVVSGINSGMDTGHSVLHSGTVGSVRAAVVAAGERGLQFEYRTTDAELDPTSDTALVEAGFVTLTAIAGIAEVDVGRDTPPGVDAEQVDRELHEAPAPN